MINYFKSLFSKNRLKYSTVDYNKYFENQFIEEVELAILDLGDLNLPSGKIIACDPLVCIYDTLPFNKIVKPGSYPVTVCIAKTAESGDRYTVVKLTFSSNRAVKWELAVIGEKDIKDLKEPDDYVGFPVDAGLGCFLDIKAQEAYNKFEESQSSSDFDIYNDLLEQEFKKNASDPDDPNDAGDWLDFKIPGSEALNVIMFHSGYGDGVYPCYWGIDSNNQICSLVVDFFVV